MVFVIFALSSHHPTQKPQPSGSLPAVGLGVSEPGATAGLLDDLHAKFAWVSRLPADARMDHPSFSRKSITQAEAAVAKALRDAESQSADPLSCETPGAALELHSDCFEDHGRHFILVSLVGEKWARTLSRAPSRASFEAGMEWGDTVLGPAVHKAFLEDFGAPTHTVPKLNESRWNPSNPADDADFYEWDAFLFYGDDTFPIFPGPIPEAMAFLEAHDLRRTLNLSASCPTVPDGSSTVTQSDGAANGSAGFAATPAARKARSL